MKYLFQRRLKVNDLGKLDYEYLYYLFDPRKVVLGSRKLNDALCDYVIYSNIHDELPVYD
jgi:hypothetical protein